MGLIATSIKKGAGPGSGQISTSSLGEGAML